MIRVYFNNSHLFPTPFTGSAPLFGRHASRLAKAALDKVFAALACLVLAPLMLLICLIIKLDTRGPALFAQERHGLDNKVIKIFKFRTMHTIHCQRPSATQAKKDDQRVTRAGRILRRTSLDELPQIFNVLKGDMSIVGPRPHPLFLNETFSPLLPEYDKRHIVKPGITGWAQIHGWRGETDTLEKMRGRLDHDLYYINNWSILLDLRIIVSTALIGWIGKNAY